MQFRGLPDRIINRRAVLCSLISLQKSNIVFQLLTCCNMPTPTHHSLAIFVLRPDPATFLWHTAPPCCTGLSGSFSRRHLPPPTWYRRSAVNLIARYTSGVHRRGSDSTPGAVCCLQRSPAVNRVFWPCAGDAASGSSQTVFGSGSLLLAPLSNFRAGTLPTTVSLPHSHKPETDSLPACLAARSPSHCLFSLFYVSPLLSSALSLSRPVSSPAVTNSAFSCGSWSLVPGACPLRLSSVSVWCCAFRIIGLQSHSQHLNHVARCHCLSSAPPLPLLRVSLHFFSTHCGLAFWPYIPMLFPF